MLVRGSLEASDFVYDQASQSVKLSIEQDGGGSDAAKPVPSAGAGVGGTNAAAVVPTSKATSQAGDSADRPSVVMDLVTSPSAPAVGLGALLGLGGLWYFFVFIHQPKEKPRYRR